MRAFLRVGLFLAAMLTLGWGLNAGVGSEPGPNGYSVELLATGVAIDPHWSIPAAAFLFWFATLCGGQRKARAR